MERAADVGLGDGRLITGGDVSPEGSVVGLRTYTEVLLWDRGPGQTVPEALAGQPCTAAVGRAPGGVPGAGRRRPRLPHGQRGRQPAAPRLPAAGLGTQTR